MKSFFSQVLKKFSTSAKTLHKNVSYFEGMTKHRVDVPLYDLVPKHEGAFIAPNATLIGEVFVGSYASVWFNCVIRGDINAVRLYHYLE